MNLFSILLLLLLVLLVDWSALFTSIINRFGNDPLVSNFFPKPLITDITLAGNETFVSNETIRIRDRSIFRVNVEDFSFPNETTNDESLYHLFLNTSAMIKAGMKPGYRIMFLSEESPFYLNYQNQTLFVFPGFTVELLYNPTPYQDFTYDVYLYEYLDDLRQTGGFGEADEEVDYDKLSAKILCGLSPLFWGAVLGCILKVATL